MKHFFKIHGLYIAWITALIGMIGSLYFSEILSFIPCALCWYQRIALYPLVVIIPLGIIRKDRYLADYILALSGIGILISGYQNLLYYGVIPERLAPCANGVSCLTQYLKWFGFIDIPLLSLIGFVMIFVVVYIHKQTNQ